jgi:hypothetical protein
LRGGHQGDDMAFARAKIAIRNADLAIVHSRVPRARASRWIGPCAPLSQARLCECIGHKVVRIVIAVIIL